MECSGLQGPAALGGQVKVHVVALLLLLLAIFSDIAPCNATSTSYELVKSPVYPRLSPNLKTFRDPPVHGPIVAVQVWYDDNRIFGLRSTFMDKYRSPIHGYPTGNTSTVTFDPKNNIFFTSTGVIFGSTGPDGIIGSLATGFVHGNRTATLMRLQPEPNQPLTAPDQFRSFGGVLELAAVGYGAPGIIVGLSGSVDGTGLVQLGFSMEARPLFYKRSPPKGGSSRRLSWPKSAVVRAKPIPRLPPGLIDFDDGSDGKHGEVVKVELWVSAALGVLGIRSTFLDGFRSPVHGFAIGKSITLEFDPKNDPLIAIGGRGGNFGDPDGPGVFRLGGLAFFRGGSSPPQRTPVFGSPEILVYSDSADGRVVGFFGRRSASYIVQLGVYVVNPANGLVVVSGLTKVNPPTAVAFDHAGDFIGVDSIDVYYDNSIGLRGLQFTYVSLLGVKVTTPVYGQALGRLSKVQFDYVNNPLVNVGVYVSNVLNGKGEAGLVGLAFHTAKGDFIGTFGVLEFYFNLTDGTRRIVGFHGLSNAVVNTLGCYTAPI